MGFACLIRGMVVVVLVVHQPRKITGNLAEPTGVPAAREGIMYCTGNGLPSCPVVVWSLAHGWHPGVIGFSAG